MLAVWGCVPLAEAIPQQLLIFLAWFLSLFIPLFLVPEALLRLGFKESWSRLIGWLSYVIILAAVIGMDIIELSTEAASLWPVLAAIIILAVAWDIRKARRREAGRREGPRESL
jgi:uncharacterized membrane protein YagU involved in acid resistance